MFLCYIDESGTPEQTGNTSHYVLCGLAIPIQKWQSFEKDIMQIKSKYKLDNEEIHTAWIARHYLEQTKIANFEKLSYIQRIYEVEKYRKNELIRLSKSKSKGYKQVKKNYSKTQPYIHLTYDERMAFLSEVAMQIRSWKEARIFAECIDKVFFNPSKTTRTIDEQAFEQLVSRFEQYLKIDSKNVNQKKYGLLIHDNNETVAKKHTNLMRIFHEQGTFWTNINNIIETPLFVNSELTGMIQLADLCSFALRRYVENNEDTLFKLIFPKGDRKDGKCVGIRHFTEPTCNCEICKNHS